MRRLSLCQQSIIADKYDLHNKYFLNVICECDAFFLLLLPNMFYYINVIQININHLRLNDDLYKIYQSSETQ